MNSHRAFPIVDPSDAGEVRRIAVGLASSAGFDQSDAGRVALVVTEVATNILKHAVKGQMLLRKLPEEGGGPGLEVIGLDKGRGMEDVARCMRDGFSTAGSPGTGLGAISRLASRLEIYSGAKLGTALFAIVFPKSHKSQAEHDRLVCGAVGTPAPNETESGDSWCCIPTARGAKILVADGLGHGPEAAKAAREAVRVLRERSQLSLDQLLLEMHHALASTRGAAASCADIDLDAGLVGFAGAGNVTGMLANGRECRNMVSQNGTFGGRIGTIHPFTYPWRDGGCLIMHTDGLNSHVDPLNYPGLLGKHPSLIAAVLYRDFVRGRDDATVVVCRG
ncbi:MAG TPA: ATP-binding SpoIIE family protein phosphatase [Polyangiaceae bacterium]|nr:ATP-binding SpoIIE family protein phosphatase [Polyangiaceae bacterium]